MRRVLPSSSLAATELVGLCKKELELCKVHPDETVLIFTDPNFNQFYSAAMFEASRLLGAKVFQIMVASDEPGVPGGAVLQAWKNSDMIIPLTHVDWLYSHAHNEALDAGARTLMAFIDPPDIMRRLFPCEEVRQRSVAGAQVLDKGSKIRVTSDAGTDLVMDKTGRRGGDQYGVSDVPGRWDHWPSGMVSCAPLEGSADGKLVVDGGDILLQLNRYAAVPIELTIKDGRIIDIKGGCDAVILKQFFLSWDDPKAYVVSHVGWGTDHRARWHTRSQRMADGGGGMDAESFLGCMQIAFGSNFFRNLGGANVTKCHIDIECLNTSFYIDDELIVDRGKIVDPRCK